MKKLTPHRWSELFPGETNYEAVVEPYPKPCPELKVCVNEYADYGQPFGGISAPCRWYMLQGACTCVFGENEATVDLKKDDWIDFLGGEYMIKITSKEPIKMIVEWYDRETLQMRLGGVYKRTGEW